MKLVLASDHAGYELKCELLEGLRELKAYQIGDFGAHSNEPSDYADFAHAAIQAILAGTYERAILICGTGVGMSITANRYPGIRAVCCSDVFTARFSRAHYDTNVLALGGRVIGFGLAWEIVNSWLHTEFEGGERHLRRIHKIERKS